MIELPWTLPKDVESLQSLTRELMTENIRLSEELKLLQRKKFGKSSEKDKHEPTPLFNEVESIVDANPEAGGDSEDAESDIEVKPYKRGRPIRKPLPENLPRVRVEFDLTAEEKLCSCGCEMKRIGEESSEQLDIIPARFQVIQNVRFKYACRSCEANVKIAALPLHPISKSIASPGLLAYCAVSKYQDALPLYRQEQIFHRIGVDLNRATIAHWMIRTGQLLTPLVNLLQEYILSGNILHMDETHVQVMKGTGKRPETKNYMWIIYGGPPEKKATIFIYDPSRAKTVPNRILADYSGYLVLDAYKGYDEVCKKEEIIRVGCWAHVRRKFDDAEKTGIGGKASSLRQSTAQKAKGLIAKLYALEELIGELPAHERLALRVQEATPIVEEFFAMIHELLPKAPPKSLLGKALNYAFDNYKHLIRFLEDPDVPLDNNPVENAIRPFAPGRKNWLFADTVKGADASANIYSIIESAKDAGHEPYFYLKMLLAELPKASTVEDLEKLLPFNITPMTRVLA
jgi:transposase